MSNNTENIQKNISYATKWSTITEIAAKIVVPIINILLARILSPEAFGIVATITMITSFVEMFTDAGFQKYLIQHEFESGEEQRKNTNVAFWTNFAISIFLLLIIVGFSKNIAFLVGSPGLGNVIIIASLQIPLTSFSSIQMALYRRNFDFKTLFIVRLAAISTPLFITVPLALLGFGYWSIIIGNIGTQLVNAIVLTVKSSWKPEKYFSFKILKEMFSFSIWSLIEAISIWLTTWVDIFIIGSYLSEYYLGLYKTSTTVVNSIMGLITAAIIPVLFSSLSRVQNDEIQFYDIYFTTQKLVSIFVLPLGVGIFIFSDFLTNILLGSQWNKASDILGIWALTSAITIIFGHFASEVYRAKGKPKLSFFAQVLHLIVLIPVCMVSANYGFWTLIYARSWIRLELVMVHFLIMKFSIGIPIFKAIQNTFPMIIASVIMGMLGFLLQPLYSGWVWNWILILFCILIYFSVLCLFPKMRKELSVVLKKIFLKYF